jgi:hypothetical protein
MNIIFAHNCHNRPKTLIKTISLEKFYYPNSTCYISVTENGGISENDFSDIPNVKFKKTFGNTWQLGCVNCFYSLISDICSQHNDAIIIFSHDDVFLSNNKVVNSNINKMINENLSYILRRPKDFWGPDYFIMEVVYLRVQYIKQFFELPNNCLFNYETEINRDILNSISAESWLASKLKNCENGLIIDYEHQHSTNEIINSHLNKYLGYTHKNFGITGWIE